jgi:hypothetical protein
MNKQFKMMIPLVIVLISVAAYFVIPRGSALKGILAQRYNILRDHGYTITETPFTQFIYYTERSECIVTTFEEPDGWDAFHAKLTVSMDSFSDQTRIHYVNDQSENHVESLYFKVETGQHHEVVVYRFN